METIRRLVEWIALSIEMLAVIVIIVAIVDAVRPRQSTTVGARSDAFSAYKQRMGRGLLLALELLLAADVISTVVATPTLQSLAALGLLALIRTFLSWSLDVEIDGCWPWRVRAEERAGERGETTKV